jgi:ureidoacrylate peracid hydrolase
VQDSELEGDASSRTQSLEADLSRVDHPEHAEAASWDLDPTLAWEQKMHEQREALSSLVDPQHTALLVVDVQRWFIRERSEPMYPPVEGVLTRLRSFIDEARAAGVRVVRIQNVIPDEMYSPVWRRQFQKSWGSSSSSPLTPESWGTAFCAGFEPLPGDFHLTKPRYSAFIGTSLEIMLRSQGIQTVLVGGLTTDVCVSSTSRDAFQLEFNVITLSDCTATATQARHESGLATLASVFGMVCSSDEVLDAWKLQAVPTIAS